MGGMHVVAFHGYPLDRRIWEPLAGRAAAGPRAPSPAVSAPDSRGRATALPPAAPVHAMSLLADDMAEEISHALPAGEPFLLAGLSMGRYVAVAFVQQHAARFRGRIEGLALFDTKASSDDDAGRVKRREAIESIRKDGIEAALSAMLPKLLARSSKGK